MTLTADERQFLRERFAGVRYDENVQTPSYRRIGIFVAESPDILELLGELELPKRNPAQLYAAVRYLMAGDIDTELRAIYNAPETHEHIERIGPAFVEFCREYPDDIIRVMRARIARRNEINRACAFVPVFMQIARDTGKPLGILEIGASAGFKLLVDRYHFGFGPFSVGPPGASVRLHTRITGKMPQIDAAMPNIEVRLGIDKEPLNAAKEDDERWIRACIPLGNVVLEQRLDAAIELTRREWNDVERGNISMGVPWALAQFPAEVELCIISSHAVAPLLPTEREILYHHLCDIATTRSIWWITLEPPGVIDEDDAVVTPDRNMLRVQHLWPENTTHALLATTAQDCADMHWVG